MTTVSVNEKINLQFVVKLDECEKLAVLLKRCGFDDFEYNDVTKDYPGDNYPFAEGRKEVVFDIKSIDITDAAFIRQLLQRS